VIHVNTVSGLGEASQTLLEMARVFRVPLWKKAVYIHLPAVFPYLLSACRTALGMAFKSGIAAEVISVPDGSIGEGLYLSKIYLSTAELFAWTLTIIAVSLLSEKLFLLLLRAAARMRRMLSAHMPERTETKTDPKTAPGTSADTDIILKDISKWFGQEKILEHFNFIFRAGSAYCLMAPSGTGKTTLLNLLMGLELPDSGTVLGLEGKKISAVFQEDRLLEDCTILENIRFATGRRLTVPEITQEVLRLLPKEALTKPVCEFSGGMKRRAALLRALLTPADLFLMDEPFTGLDREARLAAASLIKEYSRGKLLIVSTHAPDDARLLDAEIVTLNLT
jgi:NitT/TauT family transport system permease protein